MAIFLTVRTSDGVVENACEGAPQAPVAGREFIERAGQAASAWTGWVRRPDGSFFDPRVAAQPAPVVVLAKVDLFRRCTEDEAVAIMGALAEQGARLQQIFSAALSYRSDAPEWPILVQAAQALFGEARSAELLAPSA